MEIPRVASRGSLSRLTTSSNEGCRRDSISSSRTRDSGYNSDLEFSFSPVDLLQSCSAPRFLLTPPSLPDRFDDTKQAIAFHSTLLQPTPEEHQITSYPATIPKGLVDVADARNSQTQDDEIDNWARENLPSRGSPRERLSSLASLSSNSSCDFYTNSDDSNDEEDGNSKATQLSLPRPTRKSISLIMRKVEVDLRQSANRQCYGGSAPRAHDSSTPISQQGDRKSAQSNTKRKARSDDHLSPNDNDDDGTSKRRRGSLPNINGSEPGTMFACPFYKHDPTRYRSRRTCLGPGWPTVHRVKEHLYRAHVQSIYCPRCYSMFDTDNDLSTHLRSQQCQVSAAQPIEGIDRETLKALRKRSPALRLEEDKWRDMYHLLFPQVLVENIPSPFYNDISPNESSRLFRRELLRRVQQELINRAQQLPGPVEQQLLRQVAGIVQSIEEDLINTFRDSGLPSPPLTDRRESTSTIGSSSSQAPSHIATPLHMPIAQPEPTMSLPSTVEPVVFDDVTWGDASNDNPSQVWSDWNSSFPPIAEEQFYKEHYDGAFMGSGMGTWPS